MATTYRVGSGQTYTTWAAAITQLESDGVGDTRIMDIDAETFGENPVFGALAWTRPNHIEIISNSGLRDVTLDGSGGAQALNLNSQQHIRMNGIIVNDGTANQIINQGHYSEFRNCKASGTGIGFHGGGNMILWEGCEADTCTIGFQPAWGGYMLDCYAHDCTSYGINFPGVGELDVEGCRSCNNTGDGMNVTSVFGIVCFLNSTFSGNAKGIDIEVSGVQYDMVNCIVADNTNFGIDIAAPFRCCRKSQGNIFYNNTNGHINVQGDAAKTTLADVRTWTRSQTGRATEDEDSIDSNPLLNTDGTIQAGSPAINAGVSGSLMKGGSFSVDAHHPAIGADGQWDVELDFAPPPFQGIAPVFAADSRLDQDTVTTTPAAATAFPASNLSDDRVFTVFKPTSTATTVDIKTDAGVGNTANVDYFGLIGHDLFDPAADGNGAVTLTFASSPDDSTYTTIFSVTATDNRVIFRAFSIVTARYFRLRLTRAGTFIPSLGELQWGRRVEVPAGIETGFDPEDERVEARFSQSQSGNLLGAISSFSNRKASLRLRFVTDTFMRGVTVGQFGDFWRNHASLLLPFFFSWNPGNPGSFEKDTFFGVFDARSGIRRDLATQLASGLRNLDITVLGQAET